MNLLSTPHAQKYSFWRNKLGERVASADSTHEFFWLIDPCAHAELPGLIWNLEANPEVWPLYMNTYLEESVNAGPFMASYRKNTKLTAWMFENQPLLPLGCLIEVDSASAKAAFEHLQNLVEFLNSDGKRSVFRFYDPRIVYGISTYEDASRIPRILGPILRLDAWEPGRCAAVCLGNGSDIGIRCEEPARYDAEFFEHIWNEVQIHTIIGTLGREPGMALRSMPLPDAYRLVEQTGEILEKFGYADRTSLAYGAGYSAYYGISVWSRPEVEEAMRNRPAQAPLSEIMESVEQL
jgi:hypothetical protein